METSHISSTGERLRNVSSVQVGPSFSPVIGQNFPFTPKRVHHASVRASSSEAPDSEPDHRARRPSFSPDPYQPSSPTPVPQPFIPAPTAPKERSLITSLLLSSTEHSIFGSNPHGRSRLIPRQGLIATDTELGNHAASLGVSEWVWDMQERVARVEETSATLTNAMHNLQDHHTMPMDLSLERVQAACLDVTTAVSRLTLWSTHIPARWHLDDHHQITWEWRQTDIRRQQLQQLLLDNGIPIPPPYRDEADGPAQIDKTSYEDPPTLRELKEMWEEDEENKSLWEASMSPRALLNSLCDY